jgi:hypothetical protein
MKTIFFIFLGIISLLSANALNLVEDGAKIIKGGKGIAKIDDINLIAKAGSLNKVTQRYLTLSKVENIQNLMALSVKENRVDFVDQFKYITVFKNIKHGDKLLLKCLKHSACDLEKFSDLMRKSPLHVQIATKYPNMNLPQINHRVGSINENIMNKYFQSTGWTKIEGEVGRNGIDGLFIKRKNGVITDVMVVESKYNKSGLQHTNNGKQMTKQWVSKKIEVLQKKYPNNKDYNAIEKYIENDSYRALLWNLKTSDENLIISLKKVHDKSGKIITSNLKGGKKMKINFNGNQEININNPKGDFHRQVVSWYKKEINIK